jgi:signal transduction histidine kinase
LTTYLSICAAFLVLVYLVWDIGRRRAHSERERRELEPYAKLGEGIEGAAHDARGLLRAARLSLEQLEGVEALSEEAGTLALRATVQVREAERFLGVLGTDPDSEQSFDAVSTLRMVAALHSRRRSIDARGVEGEIPVRGRPRDCARLFSNLVANALEHAGEARLRVEGRAVLVENPLLGPGPFPGPEIFERGHSSKPHGKGLGLALVRSLAADLGAEVRHEPVDLDGKPGIRFRVELGNPSQGPSA